MPRRPVRLVGLLLALTIASACLGVPIALAQTDAPHVARTLTTDACSICHRAHSAASTITVEPTDGGPARNALIGGSYGGEAGDTALCFSCHDGLGATEDLLTVFGAQSAHILAPNESEYGPQNKRCSSCHDSHGTARKTGTPPDGEPYAALLESTDASGTIFNAGDAFCTVCHGVRAGNEFPGPTVWQQTAHATIATDPDGTQVVCSVCHEPHGSAVPPLMRQVIVPPSVAATATALANDRTLCAACHSAAKAGWPAWPGMTVYETSSHGSSDATIAVTGEWASEETTRAVGECQSCHAAMGAVDGDGNLIPKLQKVGQPASCRACHSEDGPASTDFASLAHRPGPQMLSIAAAFGGNAETASFGGLDLFSRRTTDTPTVWGPRRFASVGVSAHAVADFDDDGDNEVVAAYAGANRIAVLGQNRNRGLAPAPGDVTLLPADEIDLLAAGDLLSASPGPELIVAARGDDFVRVYAWNGVTFTSTPADEVNLGGGLEVTGITVGTVSDGADQIVVTVTDGVDSGLVVISGGTSLTAASPVALRVGATSPMIFNHDGSGYDEIVVANAGVSAPLASIVRADGSEVASAGVSADSSATAVWMADVLPNRSGTELAVTLAGDDGVARVEVYPAAGLDFAEAQKQTASLPASSTPSALAAGDVDGDGTDEFVVALAGAFSRDGDGAWPGISVLGSAPDGLTLSTPDNRATAAVEGAGSAGVLVADLGPIGPSRHPAGESGSHESTETAVVESHVVCSDCHDPHSAKTIAATAPDVMGLMRDVGGVAVTFVDPTTISLAQKQDVDYEYEVCLKCHSAWSETGKPVAGQAWPETIGAVRSIAAELNTTGESFHPVAAPAGSNNSSGTLVPSVDSGSQVYCVSCHGTSATGPEGPHTSPTAPLLQAAWRTGDAADSDNLCYTCHRVEIYGASSTESTATVFSGFFEEDLTSPGLHARHTALGYSCAACHVSHGSANLPALLRDDTGWDDPAGPDAGECSGNCHAAVPAAYSGP